MIIFSLEWRKRYAFSYLLLRSCGGCVPAPPRNEYHCINVSVAASPAPSEMITLDDAHCTLI
jgi:hypothetical protein